ncbi:MAG: protein O-mannosyl-transferase family [Planctomycetota bacterium]|jgi:hypothetical protein
MLKLTNKNLQTYLAIFFSAAILYIITCAPGPLWQDSGHYQYRIFHNDIQGTLGLALSHPMYMLIGIAIKYIPFGDLAYKINLISAIAGAFTIANIFLLTRLWSGKSAPALISAVTLALSHTFWLHTAVAEVYTLYTALFSTELLMVMQFCRTKKMKFLYWLALLNGLAIATHMWAVLALGCYIAAFVVLMIKKKVALPHLMLCIILWCIGASAYIFLITKNMVDTGQVHATLASSLFGNNWQSSVLNLSISSKLIKENLILIAYNFPTPNIILFLIALFGLKKIHQFRNFFYLLLSMLILYFIFAFRYTVPDRFAFFIPFYLLVSIFVGFGTQMILTQMGKPILYRIILILALLPIPAYIITPKIAKNLQFNLSTKREIPYRNDYHWFLTPWKTNYTGPVQFAQEVFESTPQDAAIFADSTTSPPLLYLQDVYEKRDDLTIVSPKITGIYDGPFNQTNIHQVFDQRPLYTVSPLAGYCPSYIIEQFDFIKDGILYRIVKKQ